MDELLDKDCKTTILTDAHRAKGKCGENENDIWGHLGGSVECLTDSGRDLTILELEPT